MSVRSALGVAVERAARPCPARATTRAEVAGLLAEQRLGDDRRPAVGAGLVVERVVERLAAAGAAAVSPSSLNVPLRSARTSLRSALSTSSSCTGLAVRATGIVPPSFELRRRRRARAAGRRRSCPRGRCAAGSSRVASRVDRPARASSIDIVTVAVRAPGLVGSTLRTLADLDAGDPDGRVRLHAARVAERRLDLVRLVDERDVLREPEERHDDDDREQRRAPTSDGVACRAALSSRPPPGERARRARRVNVWPCGHARLAGERRALVARRARVDGDRERSGSALGQALAGSRAGRSRSRPRRCSSTARP